MGAGHFFPPAKGAIGMGVVLPGVRGASRRPQTSLVGTEHTTPHRFYGESFLRGGHRLPPVSFRIDREAGDYALFYLNVTVIFAFFHVPSPIMHIFPLDVDHPVEETEYHVYAVQ
jgi:hypothetical protein